MTSHASSTTDGTTRRIATTARLLAVLAVLTMALAACSSGHSANDASGHPATSTRASPPKPITSAKAAASAKAATKKTAWDGDLPTTDYPGAAALVSKAAASIPAETVLPPANNAHADMPQYWLDHCLDDTEAAAEKVCVYGDTKNPVLTVAMVGGSVDGSWFPALLQIAEQRHWRLVTDLHGTCEWTATMLVRSAKGKYTACYEWGQATLKDLETKIKPAVVITGGLPEDGTVGDSTAGSDGALADIATGMATYWTDLEHHGISVVAMQETPVMGFLVGDCVAKYGRTSTRCMVPAATAILADPPTVRAAADTGGRVPVIDMNQFICGPTECAPVVGNVLVYFDGRHLTSSYSRSMTKYLEPRLLKAAPALAQ
jgi:hypothetical protein